MTSEVVGMGLVSGLKAGPAPLGAALVVVLAGLPSLSVALCAGVMAGYALMMVAGVVVVWQWERANGRVLVRDVSRAKWTAMSGKGWEFFAIHKEHPRRADLW
jgi:hypothetical protein